MIMGMTFSEGEWPLAVQMSALEVCDVLDSGEWRGEKVAALFFGGRSMVYDFILRDKGRCPVRYRPSPESQRMLWA